MTPTTMRVLRAFEGTGTMVFEGKKHRLFHGKDGYIFTLVLHPQDVPLDLMRAKLGAAWTIALIPDIEEGERQEAEQPPAPPPPSPEKVKESTPFLHKPRSQQAGMLLNDPQFRAWWGPDNGEWNAIEADHALKTQLHIASKRDLDQPGPAADAWDRLVAQFRADTGQSTWERPA